MHAPKYIMTKYDWAACIASGSCLVLGWLGLIEKDVLYWVLLAACSIYLLFRIPWRVSDYESKSTSKKRR